jgi:hypothetical protein
MTRDELIEALRALAKRYAHECEAPTEYVFEVPEDGDDPTVTRQVVVSLREKSDLVLIFASIREWEEDGSLAISALRANVDSLATRVCLYDDELAVDFRRALGHLGREELFEAVEEVAMVAAHLATDALERSGESVDRALASDGDKN